MIQELSAAIEPEVRLPHLLFVGSQISIDAEIEYIRAMVVTGNVERHSLAVDHVEIKVRGTDGSSTSSLRVWHNESLAG